MYTELTVKNNVYKLRLSTQNLVALEKQIGCNPLTIFGNGDTIPTVDTMVKVLFYSLQDLQHGIDFNKAFKIFDEYIEDNHIYTDFIAVIIDIYKVSGLIRSEEKAVEVEPKN